MKKIILMILVCFILYFGIKSCAPTFDDEYILEGYSNQTSLNTGSVPDFSIYNKYYYDEYMDQKFIDSGLYQKVEEINIQYISEYFDYIKRQFKNEGMGDGFDFDNNVITVGDYFHISTKEGQKISDAEYGKFDIYKVYLYDMETHTLYFIHEKS